MLSSFETLLRYDLMFHKNAINIVNPNRLGWHIFSHDIPATVHGFVNGIARMVYNRRKFLFPDCDQWSDWIKSEQVVKGKISVEVFKLLSVKSKLLATFSGCIDDDAGMPSIENAMEDLGVCDERILVVLEGLEEWQWVLILDHFFNVLLDDATVELFLGKEITEFYLTNEGEILRLFEISC